MNRKAMFDKTKYNALTTNRQLHSRHVPSEKSDTLPYSLLLLLL